MDELFTLDNQTLLSQTSNNLPLVSVIIPAYNSAAFIERTLNSVLNQTYTNIEVIVVDDGSHDHTSDIVQSILHKDARVRLLQQPNSGVAAARNLGIKYANGEFIAPIDADDIWYPQNLEKQIQSFQKSDSSVGVVYSWSMVIDETDTPTGDFHVAEYEGNVYIPLLYSNFFGNASSCLIRRSCLERVGGYNCELKANGCQGCEDWELYLRIAECYQVRFVPEFLIGYRHTTGSMSNDYTSMINSVQVVLTSVQQRHPEIPDYIYRWSRSLFYIYMARRSSIYGKYLITLSYLYKSLELDLFMTLLRHDLYIQVFKILINFFKSVIHYIFPHSSKHLVSNQNIHPQPQKTNNIGNLMKIKKLLPSTIYKNMRIHWLSKRLVINPK